MKKQKRYIKITFIFIYVIIALSTVSYCADPKIVSTLTKAFEEVEDWLLKLSTPAAAVAVGTGVFMKKFSFGDEERLRIAKKLIRTSLFSYGFILTIDLILSAISSLVG
ncbi:MAG: hypothetical protein Q4G05_05600 [Clostridia bacterium]|nr:hypothetical protein [Clostridia bacterium]